MGKPTKEEFTQALYKAAEMRENGGDPDFVAKSLLNLNYRYENWQRVVLAAKLYLHSGQGSTEHARLVKAIQNADSLEKSNNDETTFGLE